jgi:hypothetical protein
VHRRSTRTLTATVCAAGLFLAACDGTDGPSSDPPVQPTDDGQVDEDVDPMPQDDPEAEAEPEAEQPGGDADPDDEVDADEGTDAGGVG